MKNITLFVISAAIAIMLFLFVHSQRNSIQRVLVVPVEIQNMPRNKVILDPARQIEVTIQGPAFMVGEAAAAPRSVKKLLPPDIGDQYEMTFDERDLGLPPAIEVLRIEPNSIKLIFDRRVKKTVPVVVPRVGKFKESLKLISFKVEPAEVEISGAQTEVRGITQVETLPLDLRDLEGEVERVLPLRDTWKYTRAERSEVGVLISLLPIVEEKDFPDIPIEVRSRIPRSVTLEPQSVKVQVSAMSSVIGALKVEDIVAFVKLGEEQQAAADVHVALPNGVSLVRVEPGRVQVSYPPPAPQAASSPPETAGKGADGSKE